jgi:hypothetical protein
VRGQPVNTLRTPVGLLDVVPFVILAVVTPQGLVQLDEPVTL